uniref:Fibrinogen C domain-containing protein 1-like n=1 Tax=Drosophila rhopaloa TaxID=1041015 RepID=A0A6P4ETH3_DRORH
MKVPGLLSFKAPCTSSGWMVIQRRQDGSEDFARKWNDYRTGFGSLTGEFFIGLEKIHQMTKNTKHELLIWLVMLDGSRSYARYDDFKIGSNDEFYKLISVGEYSGKAGDSLVDSVGSRFSTVDNFTLDDCKTQNTGGWWYPDCDFQSALNGLYYNDGEAMPFTGIQWTTWNGNLSKSIAFTEIMIKPK